MQGYNHKAYARWNGNRILFHTSYEQSKQEKIHVFNQSRAELDLRKRKQKAGKHFPFNIQEKAPQIQDLEYICEGLGVFQIARDSWLIGLALDLAEGTHRT